MYPKLSHRKGLKLYKILVFPCKSKILGDSVAHIFLHETILDQKHTKIKQCHGKDSCENENSLKHMA